MFFKTHVRWVKVFSEKLFNNDFLEGVVRPLSLKDLDVLCVKLDGELKVFEKSCPHQKASLVNAVYEEGTVVCPWHKYAFDLETGRDICSAGNTLKIYPTKLEDGYWFVGEEVRLPFWMDPA